MIDFIKTYSGYAYAVEPIWVRAHQWAAEHPKAMVIYAIVATFFAVF